MNILLERFPYRYVEMGELENGSPDCRIQKMNSFTKRYKDMYLCDNSIVDDYNGRPRLHSLVGP